MEKSNKYGKMAILINSLRIGGAEQIVSTLIRNYGEKYSIELIILENILSLNIPDGIKYKVLTKKSGNESGFTKIITIPIYAIRLKDYIKRSNIKVIQSHVFRSNYINILAKIFGSKHYTQIVIHGVVSQYKKKGLSGIVNLLLIKHLFPKADSVIVNTKGVKYDLQKFIKKKISIRMINNPFDISYIERKSIEKFTNEEIQFNIKINYLISIGRFIPTKRHTDILHAFAIVLKTNPNCRLILIGDGEERKRIEQLADKLNIKNKIHFIGITQNPYKYLKMSKVSIIASESESFGNTIVESMICKCPVIATDCDFGPREILKTNKSFNEGQIKNKYLITDYGILVKIGEYNHLASAIIRILNDTSLRSSIKEKAYSYSKKFDIINLDKCFRKFSTNILQ